MGTPNNPVSSGIAAPTTPGSPTAPSNSVAFLFQGVPPPSILYIQRDDVLVVQAATSQTGEFVTFNARVLQPNGTIEQNQFILRPGNARAVVQSTPVLSEGYLLSLAVSASVATARGQTFARAFISRSSFGTGQPAQTIFADYVTTLTSSGYPNGRILSPVEGPGNVYSFAVANPAAGSDWSQAIPVNSRWRVRSWEGVLTTSAAVANRGPATLITATAGATFTLGGLAFITASLVRSITAVGITPYVPANLNQYALPLPPDLLLSGNAGTAQQIGSNTAALDVADQWSNVRILVEEWLDNV